MKKKPTVYVLFAFIVLSSMYCTDNKTSDNSTQDTVTSSQDTVVTPAPPTKLEELKKDLESVQTEIQVEENTYRGFVGDANRAMMIVTSPSTSAEAKELAQERVDISLKAAKESATKLNKLKVKKDSIEAEINTLSVQ